MGNRVIFILFVLSIFSCADEERISAKNIKQNVKLSKIQIDSIKQELKFLDTSSFLDKAEALYQILYDNDSSDQYVLKKLIAAKRYHEKYDELLPLIQNVEVTNKATTVFVLESKMLVFMSKGIPDSINFYCKKLFDIDSNEKFIERLVTFYEEQRRPEYALELVDYAIRIKPKLYKLFLLRGLLYQELSEFQTNSNEYNQKSLKDFNLAEIHIKNYEVYGGRGWTFLLLKRYDEALNDFNMAMVDKTTETFYNNRNYMIPHILKGRGIVRAKLKDYLGAKEDLKKSYELGDTVSLRLYKEIQSEANAN